MLVLSRKPNESIVINDDIVVTVLAVECGKVRLGIEAPREIPVHRQEIHEKIQNPRGVSAPWSLQEGRGSHTSHSR